MSATKEDLKLLAPELSTETDERLDFFLSCALARINASVWEGKEDKAQLLLAAHLITLSNSGAGGGAGSVSGKSVGDVSISYSSPPLPSNWQDYHLTNYGLQYMACLRSLAVPNIPFTTC